MRNNYSPNMLKTYKTCPKKFYFQYIEKINMPKSFLPFMKGKKIHALANYYLKGSKIDKLENSLNIEEKEIWNILLKNEYFNKKFFKSEFSMLCKINNYWLSGRIDAIVYDDDKYYILDYKTGTVAQNLVYDFQTMVYLLMFDKYIKKYSALSFVYIDLKNNKNYSVKFNNDLKDQYSKIICEICERISNDKNYKCDKSDCKNCEYNKICRL